MLLKQSIHIYLGIHKIQANCFMEKLEHRAISCHNSVLKGLNAKKVTKETAKNCKLLKTM